MEQEVFRYTIDDAEAMAKLDKLEKQVVSIGKSVDTVGETAEQSFKQAADAADNFSASMDAAATDTAKQAKSVEQARAANQVWLAAIRQTIAGQQVAGRSLGEWGEQARAFSQRITEGAKATGGATTAFRIFNGVLKASGIGLLIGLVASVIAYFTKFQSGIDKVSQVMAGLNAVVNVLIERFLKVGTAIAKVFQGDFAGAAADVTAAVSGLGDELVNAATAAFNLEKRLQALRETTITQSVEAARARVELQKFKLVADDGTRSLGERAKAARNAAAIEKQLADQAVDRALEAQQIAQGQFALDRESLAAKEAAAKAEIDLQDALAERNAVIFNAEKEQREFRKQANEERQKQLDAEAKKAEALRKEYEKLFADIQKQTESLQIENNFNPVDRVLAQFEAAKGEINTLRERLLEIAPDDAARQRVNEAVEVLFDELLIKYREEYAAAADELEKLKGGKLREALNPLPPPETVADDLKFRAKTTLAALSAAADEFIEGQQPRSLLDILGISEDSFAELKDATKEALGFLNDLADGRVKEADAAVQAAERKVQAAEEALEKEKDLAAEGLANDVTLREQQLAAAKAAEEQAQKERAKAVRTQILLDSAQQVSSLITATANIFKGFSSLPIVGQILAVASIGAMFAAFGAAKAQALKAAQVPKFRKGTKLEGRSHEQGGLAISDEHGNIVGEAEGKEWLIGTKPSTEHDRFLQRLNDGEFAGVNLDRMFRPTASNPITEAAPRIERMEREFREIRETQHTAALAVAYREAAREIVAAIEEKEVVTPLTNYKVTKKRGRNTYTTVVRDEK